MTVNEIIEKIREKNKKKIIEICRATADFYESGKNMRHEEYFLPSLMLIDEWLEEEEWGILHELGGINGINPENKDEMKRPYIPFIETVIRQADSFPRRNYNSDLPYDDPVNRKILMPVLEKFYEEYDSMDFAVTDPAAVQESLTWDMETIMHNIISKGDE